MKPITWILLVGALCAWPLAGVTSQEAVSVVVATEAIPRGTRITPEMVSGEDALFTVVLYPAAPAGTVGSLADLPGWVTRVDIPREQPIARHFLFPHPADHPATTPPPPVAPVEARTVRAYGDYIEYRYAQPAPPGLASGDRVDVFTSTALDNLQADETRVLLQDVVIAQAGPEAIVFSLTRDERDTLAAFIASEATLTLALAGPGAADYPDVPIHWEYLIMRVDNRLPVPDGADLSHLGD